MSLFLEYGKDSRFLIKILTVVSCLFAVVILLLGVSIMRQNVVYINPANVIGTAKVGYIPDSSAIYFGMAFVHFLGNVSPQTVKQQYSSAFFLMSPRLQSAVLDRLRRESDEIAASNIAVQTIPTEVNITERGNNNFTIEITASRVAYAMGREASRTTVRYTIHCSRAKINANNPFGLEVTSYDFRTEG